MSKVVKVVFPVEESVLVDLKKVTVQVPVVAALSAVPVEKVRSEALFRSEVRDLSFLCPGLGSKVRVELEGGSVVGEGSLLSQKDKVQKVNTIAHSRFRKKKGSFSAEVSNLDLVWPGLGSKV